MKTEVHKPGKDFAQKKIVFDDETFGFYPGWFTDQPIATVDSITKIGQRGINYPRRKHLYQSLLCFLLSLFIFGKLLFMIAVILLIRGLLTPARTIDFIVQFADGRSLTGALEKNAYAALFSKVDQLTDGKAREDPSDFAVPVPEGLDEEVLRKGLEYAHKKRWIFAPNLITDLGLDAATATILYTYLQEAGIIDERGELKEREETDPPPL